MSAYQDIASLTTNVSLLDPDDESTLTGISNSLTSLTNALPSTGTASGGTTSTPASSAGAPQVNKTPTNWTYIIGGAVIVGLGIWYFAKKG